MKKHVFKFAKIKPTVCLYCLLLLSSSMIVYTIFRGNAITYQQSRNFNYHIQYLVAIASFRQGTDLLTETVRRYVVSDGAREYMDQYFHEVRIGRHRDRALEKAEHLPIDRTLKEIFGIVMKISRSLMETEYHAMHLIALNDKDCHAKLYEEVKNYPLSDEERNMSPQQRRKRAEELLWGNDYNRQKTEIYSHLANGFVLAGGQAEMRHLLLRRKLLRMLSLSALSLIVLVLVLCGFVFIRRRQHEQMIEAQAEENARMNVQLMAERDKALQAEKAKSFFFSTVSHDIRTPLNSIIGFSEMLQLGIDDPKEKAMALDAIITSGQTLLELINDVLDLSKLEAGKMELRPMPTNIAELVAKVANAFELATSRKSVKLRTEVGKMPLLKLDPQRMRQILFNLIGNAVKFTERGSITIRAAYTDGTFALSVADTGCGISPENISKLMSPYVQLQQARDSISGTGTGLGLAICKQLAKQMKGALELESTVGIGSTFTLRVPNVEAFTKEESEAYFGKHKAPKAEPHLDESIREKRILIADDQKLNQLVLQTMLSRLGIHKVLTVENGKEALEILESAEPVDLVLTDMFMPVMDGTALVREIRNSPRLAGLAVYVITADVEMQNGYRELGFDDMLIKPVTLDNLKELLVKYTAACRRSEAVATDGGTQAQDERRDA